METLVWTRGRAFPLSRLEIRLRCPMCGPRDVTLIFMVPGEAILVAPALPRLENSEVLCFRDRCSRRGRHAPRRSRGMFAAEPHGSLIIAPNAVTFANSDLIVALAARYRVPAIYPFAFFAKAGGLISYGFDAADQFRQGAGYVDKILRGTKPAELPVQHPTKFEPVINLKTANALGLDVPLHLQQLADEVIE
jgi:ABC transporter substrate binding protein